MKTVWSIVLGLVMTLNSLALPANDSAEIRVCSCCSCAQLDCCGTPVLPNPAPAPAPSKSTEQRVQAPALATVATLITPAAADVAELALRSFSLPQGPAIPIYERNCTYLI